VSSDGYDRLLELVAENPAQEAEELVDMATAEGYTAEETREWLEEALEANDIIEFDDKHWVVRKGKFAYDEFDHPV
jgi:hypothetical protein